MSDSVDVVLHVDTSVDVPLGQPGTPGQSAYALAVSRGFDGSEEQWLAEQKGADGQPGPTAVSADAGNAAVLGSDDLIYVPESTGGGASNWGDLGGNLADQTDLQAALDAKADSASLGSAASADTTDFATAAQGALADSAVQPGALGSAAAQPSSAFATAAQGAKADSAVQPGSLGTAAALNAPASGNAAAGEAVKGSDTRLSDSRTPTAHTHTAAQISDFADAADARVAAGISGKLDSSAAPELIRDTMGIALVAGPGVIITVNDAGDTITIDSLAIAAGSADNPHSSKTDARNGALPKNWWRYTGTAPTDNPTNWLPGDEWISA